MKRLSLIRILLLPIVISFLLSFTLATFPTSIHAAECGDDNKAEAKPGEDCSDGFGETKNCCSKGGKRYTCTPYGNPVVGGGQKSKCDPDQSDPNNNDNPDNVIKGNCIAQEQKGPCATNDQCCSTAQKQLVCYPNRNGGNGLCDLPNQDPNDRNKKADKRDQSCVEDNDADCEGNGGSRDCCRKTNDKHQEFKCLDDKKKPTNDSGKCGFVDNNTGPKCLEKGVGCKRGDWKCCGEMMCHIAKGAKEGKCREGLPDPPSPPCAQGKFQNGKCTAVTTAFGDLNTKPEEFIQSIFGVMLAMSGGIALLLIMKSGYLIMTAQGKPEALQQGRDQLVAAIVGLIFLIFSFVLLQVIGFEILKIPENPPSTQTQNP